MERRIQEHEELLLQSQQCLYAFLHTELELGSTFIDIARTERSMGNSEHFQHAKRDAKKAIESIRHFLGRLQKEELRRSLTRRCDELERSLAALV
jgi:hypothetical protein